MISEGQRNDINYAIPLLDHIEIDGSKVLADRGYDSNQLIDYIYDHGGEPTIPSRRGAKFERRCDWWFYKADYFKRSITSEGYRNQTCFHF